VVNNVVKSFSFFKRGVSPSSRDPLKKNFRSTKLEYEERHSSSAFSCTSSSEILFFFTYSMNNESQTASCIYTKTNVSQIFFSLNSKFNQFIKSHDHVLLSSLNHEPSHLFQEFIPKGSLCLSPFILDKLGIPRDLLLL